MCTSLVLSLTWFLADNAFADIYTTLRNLRELVIPLTQLMLTLSFVIGISLIWRGISMLKKFGSAQQGAEVAGPMVYLFVGAILIWIPSSSNILADSLFGGTGGYGGNNLFSSGRFDYSRLGAGSKLIGYAGGSSLNAQWSAIADTLVLYVQFIGLIAFIRGWLIVSKSGMPGQQPGSISKGITHIVGGVICINFIQFVKLVQVTLGL